MNIFAAILTLVIVITALIFIEIYLNMQDAKYVERKEHDQRFITGERKGWDL